MKQSKLVKSKASIKKIMGMELTKQTERGITLIALVVTIIVLLVLAGVSIQMIAGESGILTQAKRAKEETEIGQVKDYVKQDILEKMMENGGEDPTGEQMQKILDKYFKEVPEYPGEENLEGTKWEDFPTNFPKTLTTREEYGEHEIKIGDLYSGGLSGGETTPPTPPTPPTQTGETVTPEKLNEYQGKYVDIGLDIVGDTKTTDDWKIFYVGGADEDNSEGEEEGRIFLIAADYVESSKIPSDVLTNTGLKNKNGIYSVYWSSPEWKDLPTTPSNFINLVKHTKFTLKKRKSKCRSSITVIKYSGME